MAAFAVAFDGTRVVDASSTTGWTADGATPTAEPDFFYQGTGSISAKVKTSEAGFYYTSGSQDMTTPQVWLAKILATTKDGLDGNGLLVRIGSGTGAYYEYRKFSSTTYPVAGGWQILCIDPNVSGWRDATSGSPSLSAVVYWAIRADFSATAKSENVAMDAIDYIPNGKGLTGTDGIGATAGTWADINTADEGTANNRYGIISSKSGIFYVNGVITLGNSGTGVSFSDTLQTIVFPAQYVTTGFCGIDFDLQNASTVITMTSCVLRGRGTLTGSDDTRPDYTVTGTTSTAGLTLTGCQFNTYRRIDFTSKVSAQSCVFVSGGDRIEAAGADLRNSVLSGYTGSADSYAMSWNTSTSPNGLLDGMSFTKGSGDAHAIGFGTSAPTSFTLTDVTFTSYGADGTNSAALWFADTGSDITWTVTISGGTTPTYKKARTGDTVTIVSGAVTVAVNVKNSSGTNIQNARVLIKAASGGPFPFDVTVTIVNSGTTATVTHTTHGLATNDYVVIKGASLEENNGVFQITVTDTNTYTYTMGSSPGSSPTGTIKATYAALYGLTDASGNLSTSKVYASSQPITGVVRKSTSAPFYKTGDVAGTVSNTAGFSAGIILILDE